MTELTFWMLHLIRISTLFVTLWIEKHTYNPAFTTFTRLGCKQFTANAFVRWRDKWHTNTTPVRITVFLWMSVRECGCDLMEARQGKVVTPATTHATSSPGSRATLPLTGFARAGEEERCHNVSLSACWAYSARQASPQWAKKQMAGDSVSHQRENMSASARPPELHQPPCHTRAHPSSSTPFNLLF